MKEKIKKLINLKWISGIIIIFSLVGGCQYLNEKMGLENDHPIEEAAEDIIKDFTSLDIDLTP